MVVEIKIKEVDVNFEDRELDPKTKKLIEELSEGLQPGEDWLHYDRDRLFPPPPAPPSEVTEHIVTTMPRTGSPRRDDQSEAAADAPQRRVRSAPTLDSVPLPFVPENARQAQIVRRRKLRRAALIALVLVGLGGAVAAMWLAMQQLSAEPAPDAPQPAPTVSAAATATPSAAATTTPAAKTAAPAAQPTARAARSSQHIPQAPVPSVSPQPQPGVRPAPAATAPGRPAPSAVTPAPAPTSAPAPTKHMPGEGQW